MVEAVPPHRRLLNLRRHRPPGHLTQTAVSGLLGVEAPTSASTRTSTDIEVSEGVGDATPDPMAFIDSASVRILCGELDDPPGHARGPRANYMALSGYADQDALVEVFGHVRARNPDAKVRYAPSGRVDDGDLQSHLVMLGNLAMLQTDPRLPLPQLPVHQVEDKHIAADGEVFEIRATRQRLGPTFAGEGQARHVVEDLGMIARTPSPLDPTRTLTIFSGVFTRGVHAAVRCLSDSEIGPENVCWLTERFGHAPTWGVLMRVQVAENAIATPRLSDPGTVTFTFPTAEE